MRFFEDTKTLPEDYDLILTGDLGEVGSNCLYDILKHENINVRGKHNDCGLMIFDREKQDVHAGGSGCGCSASVLCSSILPEIEKGRYKNILFNPSKARPSPQSPIW